MKFKHKPIIVEAELFQDSWKVTEPNGMQWILSDEEFKEKYEPCDFNWRDCHSVYINLDRREDRRIGMDKELTRVGLHAQRMKAIEVFENHNPDYSKIFNRSRGALGCFLSQLSVMEQALEFGKAAFIMEDDLVFASDVKERLDYAQKFLNKTDWDIFWLGGTYHLNPPRWHDYHHSNPELRDCDCKLARDVEITTDARIIRTYGIWSTYAYIVNYKKLPAIIDIIKKEAKNSYAIDHLFIRVQPKLKCYAFVPAMVKQYDNETNIQGNGIMRFSEFANLGKYWFSDKMNDVNPHDINWAEART